VEAQDLHDMLGNLLDNACQWARSEVRVGIEADDPTHLCVVVEDDGPGIPAALRTQMLERGARLDETTPGSGLGLAIVTELAGLYGGALTLAESPQGGLSARLRLPAR
jgi:signal transduction histidine kinase